MAATVAVVEPELGSGPNSSQHAPAPASWIADARAKMRVAPQNFFAVRAGAFWFHAFSSMVLAYASAGIYLETSIWWIKIPAFLSAVFWLYRAGSFVHELCHLPKNELNGFKVAWNLLIGVPTLTPSTFFSRQHRDHHSQRVYSKPEDPEYVVNCCEPGRWRSLLGYFALIAAYPILIFLRFFLAPLSFLHPRLRAWTLERTSSFTFNPKYHRDLSQIHYPSFLTMELLCWLRASLIPLVVLLGIKDWTRMPQLYLLGFSVVLINQLRQLADHHFSGEEHVDGFEAHIADSCNFTGNDLLTRLFFPFAIRYHALHHLFPSLPYHNLAAAHQYLLRELPADSPYRDLDQGSWWNVARHTLKLRRAPA
ncbi:MAG: fatty acid desaturase [Planctomycetota bacterium]|nr:MAG: fatty acid desaturase [Planctomycetota bacterium]REK43501.1 MAG: fatty acid desaturase [Planctomycetota bacterium]